MTRRSFAKERACFLIEEQVDEIASRNRGECPSADHRTSPTIPPTSSTAWEALALPR
jgi:hypothetical protein